MIYLIGGPARCGKSTLSKRVRHEIDAQVVSSDAFIKSLLENLKSEWKPDIFVHEVNPVKGLPNDAAKLNRLRKRDKAMWPFLRSYINHATQVRDSVLVEGNIWPDTIDQVGLPHRAAFMVDTSSPDAQARRLIAIRNSDDNENNWMKDWSDERLKEWAHFNLLRSQLYVKLCQKHGYRFFDIADGEIQVAQDRAFEYLLGSAV